MNVFGLKRFLILSTILIMCFTSFGSLLHQDAHSEPIRVGVFLPLSGPTSSFGLATLNGVEMAADEINKAGGINNRQIQLISEDDQGRPENAATVVTKLIDEDRVVALLGEVASANSMAAAPIAQAAKVPMISPFGTHPAVTAVGNYIFRAAFSDPFQAGVLAEFAARGLKAKRVAVLVDNTSDYSQSLAKTFTENVSRLGGQVLMRQGYAAGDRDFKAQLVAIKSSKPDVIVVPGYYTEAGMIARQAKELRINTPLLGGDGWDSTQLWNFGGPALNGSYIVNHYASDDPSPANKEFVAKYKARYEGLEPDALAALGYDAMKMLADAIRRAGTTEGPALQEALARTKDFAGVTGSISIDKNRDTIKPAVILKLQDGKFVYHATIQPAKAEDIVSEEHQPAPTVVFDRRNVSAQRAWRPFFVAFRTAVRKRDREALRKMMVTDFYFSGGGGDDNHDGDSRDEAFQFFNDPYTDGWRAFDKTLAQGSVPMAAWWNNGAKREYVSRISPPAANIRRNVDGPRPRVAWLAFFEFRDGRWYCTSFSQCCD